MELEENVEYWEELTDFDHQLMDLAGQGLTTKEIAKIKGKSPRYIEKFFSASDPRGIFPKLGAKRRTEAIAKHKERYGRAVRYSDRVFMGSPEKKAQRSEIHDWVKANPGKVEALVHELGDDARTLTDLLRGIDTLDHMDQRSLERLRLITLALENNQSISLVRDLIQINQLPGGSHDRGNRLLVAANEISHHSWSSAIPFYHEAERSLGPGSSHAAYAALEAARMMLYLGAYDDVEGEIIRVNHFYGRILDLEAKAKSYLLRGWIESHRGRYRYAEKWFDNYMSVAEESGQQHIGYSTGGAGGPYFIGRIFFERGLLTKRKREKQRLYALAEQNFDRSYQIMSNDDEIHEAQAAYDLFRKSQLFREQGKWREARELRTEAGILLKPFPDFQHIVLEEAKILLKDGDLFAARMNAEDVLRIRADLQYANGMADASRVLGEIDAAEGKPESSLERYLAALSLFPFEDHINNRKLWEEIDEITKDIVLREGKRTFLRLTRQLKDSALSKRGHFSHLGSISPNRQEDINRIFQRLPSNYIH